LEISSDITLKGTDWNTAITKLSAIFATRTHYSLFMLCLSIGIMYDKRIDTPEENGEENKSVPRNVLQNNDAGQLDTFFQAAILSTETESFSEDERLELAFGEARGEKKNTDFNKIAFLVSFANYGVHKLVELIGHTDIESMENIKNFLLASADGRNLEIDSLPIEELDDIEDL